MLAPGHAAQLRRQRVRGALALSGVVLLAVLAPGRGTLRTVHDQTTSPRNCVDERPARVVDMWLGELVTTDQGVRWYRAENEISLSGLAWLRADGELGFVALGSVEQLKSGDYGWWG